MNIICLIKGHELADRVKPLERKPATVQELLLMPRSYIREDYCQRCGRTDKQLHHTLYDLWVFDVKPRLKRTKETVKCIKSPIFGVDLESYYRSIWLGWWLITWCNDPRPFSEFSITFAPRG
jgi:hypothetical protein